MDDIYLVLVGEKDRLKKVLPLLDKKLAELNLRINYGKTWSDKEIEGISNPIIINSKSTVMKILCNCEEPIGALNPKIAKSIKMVAAISNEQVAILLFRLISNGSLTYICLE